MHEIFTINRVASVQHYSYLLITWKSRFFNRFSFSSSRRRKSLSVRAEIDPESKRFSSFSSEKGSPEIYGISASCRPASGWLFREYNRRNVRKRGRKIARSLSEEKEQAPLKKSAPFFLPSYVLSCCCVHLRSLSVLPGSVMGRFVRFKHAMTGQLPRNNFAYRS